jgi:hypothetical protein
METQTKTQCETTDSRTEHSDYIDYFRTEIIWGGTKRTRTECLNHAALSETLGRQVTLIDRR